MDSSHTPDHLRADAEHELTLTDVAEVMFVRWKMIVAIVIAITAIALAWSWRVALYRGEGVLQTQSVSLADYKRYTIPLLDGPAFLAYLGARKDFAPDDIERVRARMPTGDGPSPWVRPAFGFTKGDVKDLPESARLESVKLDGAKAESLFVGADIQVEARSEELVRKLAVAVGDYVSDLIIRGRVVDYVGLNINDTRVALGRLENETLQNRFLLTQQQTRLAEMRDISRRYPDASRDNQRQVVSLEKGGARFFSPVAQVVGAESYIAEINETLRKLNRDREKLQADLAFLELARPAIDKAPTGREKLDLIEATLATSLRAMDTKNEAIRESYNTAKLNIGQIRYLASDGIRFVSPPVVRDPSYKQIAAVTAAAAIAGLLVGMMVALVLAWSANLQASRRGA
ncbi:MAG: hypothetical protein ABI537_14840 [Casimicrobiaceae bacterium]